MVLFRRRSNEQLERAVLRHDAHLFEVEPPSQTFTGGLPPLESRRRPCECRGLDGSASAGRIASGITWRRRRGAVLGCPHARAPKVPPKTVGPRRGEWFLGEPAGGGLTTLQCQGTAACFKHGGGKPEWGSPQNACILWGPRVGGGNQDNPQDEKPIQSISEHDEQLDRVCLNTACTQNQGH